MRILSDTDEVRRRYSEILKSSDNTSVYQTIEWLEVFKSLSCDIEFVEASEGTLVPFICKGHGLLRRAYSLPYDTYGGPVSTNGLEVPFDEVVEALNIPSVRMVDYSKILKNADSDVEETSTHLIDISGGYDAVAAAYTKMNQRAIKQAGQRGLKIKEVEREEELAAFHRLYHRASLKHRTRPLPLRFFFSIFQTMVPKRIIQYYVAIYGGVVIAGNLVLYHKDQAYDWAWAYDEAYLYLRPTNALIDRAIRDAVAAGVSWFNLGSSPSNGKGIIEFKENFGAKRHPYQIITKYGRCFRVAKKIHRAGHRFRP
jgi:hypothetical protein